MVYKYIKKRETDNEELKGEKSDDEKRECIQRECIQQHVWVPAGHRRNTDRVHNSGRGKYKAYKCELCGEFKKRYLK